MPALTGDFQRPFHRLGLKTYPVAPNTTIYKGAIVALITSGTNAGTAVPASDTANSRVVGVATKPSANNAVEVMHGQVFAFAFSGTITKSNIGQPVYAIDDNTVALTTTNSVKVGYLVDVSGNQAWVFVPAPGM